jgi:hypothetical protein
MNFANGRPQSNACPIVADSVVKVAAEIAWLAKWAIIESEGTDF